MRKKLNELFARQPLFIKIVIIIVFVLFVCILFFFSCTTAFVGKYYLSNSMHKRLFTGKIEKPSHLNKTLNYDFPFDKEEFFVRQPEKFDPKKTYGLIVYVNALPYLGLLPEGWGPVLDKNDFLFISPFKAGNDRKFVERRVLAIIAAQLMKRDYQIDPKRIYIAGQSGGARVASDVAFIQSDLFKGTIQSCGSNYFRPIKFEPGRGLDQMGNPYIHDFGGTKEEIEQALKTVKFNIITGPEDFRHSDLTSIYEQGFKQDSKLARFYDIKEMTHENVSAKHLQEVLDFLDGKTN
ncbi:MAG: hypothetical protein KIT34_07100 [Cyanobacteria bacterium TGS_CYA1]|nr:hypothetical protein [Cyanobacteria bacterium TGS_CYA1]